MHDAPRQAPSDERPAQTVSGTLVRILVGYAIAYGAFEGAAYLGAGLDLTWRQIAIALAGIVAVVVVELVLFRQRPGAALLALGLGRPPLRTIAVGVVLSLLLLAAYPLIAALTGVQFTLVEGWPLLALGIFLMNGVSEEMIYRGYLFRRLRAGRPFHRAVLLGIVFHAAAHLPILAVVGVVVGLSAVLVAVATFFPYAYLYERGQNTVWAVALVHFASDTVKLVLTAEAIRQPEFQVATLLWLAVIATVPYLALVLPPRLVGIPRTRP